MKEFYLVCYNFDFTIGYYNVSQYSSEEEQEDLNSAAANLVNKQKKELAKVDHSEINYPDFRKNFYVEVPELAKMTTEEVEQYREVDHSFVLFQLSFFKMLFIIYYFTIFSVSFGQF